MLRIKDSLDSCCAGRNICRILEDSFGAHHYHDQVLPVGVSDHLPPQILTFSFVSLKFLYVVLSSCSLVVSFVAHKS